MNISEYALKSLSAHYLTYWPI